MSKKLRTELKRLKRIGGTESLASELEAFIETLTTEKDSIPFSRRLLAEAAQAIRNNALDMAHDFIGTATEAYSHEREGEAFELPEKVQAALSAANIPPEGTFDGVPFPDIPNDAPSFEEASEEVVSGFANLLVIAGYVDEAGKYLTGYNTLMGTKGDQGETGMKDIDTLKKMRAKFKADANLNMVRTLDQVIAEMEEDDEKKDEETLEEPKVVEEPAQDTAPTGETPPPPPPPAEEPVAEEKPVLEVEPETDEEKKEKAAAEAAILKGDVKKAKQHVKKARAMERARIIAALVKAGDFDLATEGLAEAEAEGDVLPQDDVPPQEKGAGLSNPYDPEKCDFPASGPAKGEEEEKEEEMPEEMKDKTEQPAPAKGEEEEEKEDEKEEDERQEAEKIAASVKKFVKAKKMKEAVAALAKLDKLEKAIAEGVRVAEQECKDAALAKEGYVVWTGVRKSRLTAEVVIAEAEGDEEAKKDAMEAMEALETDDEQLDDTLESKPAESKELTEAPVLPAGGKPEGEPGAQAPAPVAPVEDEGEEEEEEKEEEGSEETDAMKFEVLQSVEEMKNMKVGSDDLAFTLWHSKEDPYWTVQACGKPVAEVHLKDQTDHSAIAEFFCNEQMWPMVVAQTTAKVGLYEMLKGVKARFYANAVENSKLAKTMKEKALAEVKKTSTEKLATVRSDLTDAVLVAAESLNKGLIPGKANALKKAFADRLMSLGIHNPALIVEDCFADGFVKTLEQIMADANELLEMPKEAFVHTKKMVSAAANISQSTVTNHAHETMAQRLARTSMPLAPTTPAMEAPVVQEAVAEATRFSNREDRIAMRKRLKLSAKF
jgi:hypothetical protein